MPVEPAGIESRRQPGGIGEFADAQAGVARTGAVRPRPDLLCGRPSDGGVVKRSGIAEK